MADVGELLVRIKADYSELEKALNSSKGKINGFSDAGIASIKRYAAAAAAGFAVAAGAIYKVTMAASDLQETQSKFETVFRNNVQQAEGWAKVLQDSYLLSETAAKKYLAAIQDTLVPMGMARDSAANMSFQVVKLAADLGSFNNLPTEQVMADIQSALVGNFETMKKYGVVLRATSVEQEVLNSGMAKTKDEITDAMKVQAAYNLIVRGSGDAIGDVARTSDSFANKLRLMFSQFNNLMTTMGQFTIGPATEFVDFLTHMIKKLNDTLKVVRNVTEAFGGFKNTIKATMLMMVNFGGIFDKKLNDMRRQAAVANKERLKGTKKTIEEENKAKDTGLNKDAERIQKELEQLDKRTAAVIEKTMTHAEIMGALREEFNAEDTAVLQAHLDEKDLIELTSLVKNLEAHGRFKEAELLKTRMVFQAEQIEATKKNEYMDELEKQRKQNFNDTLNFISSLATSKNRALAAVGKAASISVATMDTYEAGNKALKSAPPPFNFALMAMVLTAGFANVARIAGTKLAKGGIVMPTPGGTFANIAEAGRPEAVIPLGTQQSKDLMRDMMGGTVSNTPINVVVNVSGQFMEANPSKIQQMFRKTLLKEIRRYTDVSSRSNFQRRRGQS